MKFDSIAVNEKEFHASKQAISLGLVDTTKMVISDKFKHSDNGFKSFFDSKLENVVRLLCITLPQTSGYMKNFENGRKNRSSLLKMITYWLNIRKIGTRLKRHETEVS